MVDSFDKYSISITQKVNDPFGQHIYIQEHYTTFNINNKF